MELIALRLHEVNQLNHRVGLSRHLVDIDLCLEEQTLHSLVGLKQGQVRLAEDLVAQIFELAVGEPRIAISGEVDGADCITEDVGENPLAEAGAQAFRRV